MRASGRAALWTVHLVAVAGLASSLPAQPALDTGFGSGGVVRTGVANFDEAWSGLAQQADGRIVAVGSRSTTVGPGGANFFVARLLDNGAADASFNGTGNTELDISPSRFDFATGAVVLADGRILVAGNSLAYATVTTAVGTTFGAYSDIALARFNADGSVDRTFGANGLVRVDLSGGLDDTVVRLFVLPNGSIRVAGNTSTNPGNRNTPAAAVVGFTGSGALDTSFGSNGRRVIPFNLVDGSGTAADAALVNGQIVVAGTDGSNFAAGRLNATSGDLDTTFGEGGVTRIAFPALPGLPAGLQLTQATAVAAQADGAVVLVGVGTFFGFDQDTFDSSRLFAVRLNGAGQVDQTFSAFPNDQLIANTAAAGISGGRLVVSVSTPTAGSFTTVHSFNLGAGGALVGSRGLNTAGLTDLAVQSDGRVLLGGGSSGDATVARVNLDGPVSPPPPPAPPAIPAAASGLAATAVTATSVQLNWRDNSGNETSFIVERSTASTFSNVTTVATLAANTTTFTDRTVAARSTYFYRVRASNAGGSSVSGSVSVTTPRR